jgi:hypothetical protein
MEIERYEPYHIGIKFESGQDLDRLWSRVREALKTRGYAIPGEPQFETRAGIVPSKAVMGIKGKTNVELNFAASAINTIGEKPKDVSTIFEEVATKILPGEGYDMDVVVSFYEIIANATVKSDREPVEVLNESAKLNLEPLKGRRVSIAGLKVNNTFTLRDKNYLTEIIIEPSPSSPRNRFMLHLVYRSRDIGEISSFHDSVDDLISKIIHSLGA